MIEPRIFRLKYLSKPAVLDQLNEVSTLKLESTNALRGLVEDSFANDTLRSNSLLLHQSEGNPRRLFEIQNLIPWLHFEPNDAKLIETKRHNGWRLLNKGDIEIRQEEYLCLNDQKKGLVRIWFIEVLAVNRQDLITFEVLRGYEKEAGPIVQLIEHRLGLEETDLDGNLFARALGLDELGEARVKLGRDKKTRTVLARAFSIYLRSAFSMVPGIREDIDDECLHHYRVELRKVRSLMGIFKRSLTPWSNQLKQSLRTLMQSTNQLRDLDVFLESKQGLLNMVYGDDKKHLAEVFAFVKKERAQELKRVSKFLGSREFVAHSETCTRFFEVASPIWSDDARKRTITEDYRVQILKSFERIKIATLALNETSEVAQIHQLRILHKNLRYLLDFIADFAPSTDLHEARKKLKLSQKFLGQFNDICVQSSWLVQWQFQNKALMNEDQNNAIQRLNYAFKQKEEELRREALLHAHESISIETEALINKISAKGGSV